MVKKKINFLEEQLREIEKEVAAIVEQEDAISEDLIEAEDCYVRASRSSFALKTELEALELNREADADSTNKLVDALKEKIRIYHELVDQLLEIELEKKKENLNKEKANLLLFLKTEFDYCTDIVDC